MAAAAAPVNLNNEVVKLRKDVKKARTLIIRKLTRNITQLKAKKGTKDAILKNLRRAERLLEEIHTMKVLQHVAWIDSLSDKLLMRQYTFDFILEGMSSGEAAEDIFGQGHKPEELLQRVCFLMNNYE